MYLQNLNLRSCGKTWLALLRCQSAVAHTRLLLSGVRRWRVGSERPATAAGRGGQTELKAHAQVTRGALERHMEAAAPQLLGAETVRASCEHRRDRHAAHAVVAYAGSYFQPHLTLLLNCRFVCRCFPIQRRPCTQSVAPNFSIRRMHPSIRSKNLFHRWFL